MGDEDIDNLIVVTCLGILEHRFDYCFYIAGFIPSSHRIHMHIACKFTWLKILNE